MFKYDVIVVGVGTMGAATCAYLAQQRISVLGLEQFDIPNDLASHSGYTRVIRKAYFEHPDYVPLLLRSYELWNELEIKTASKIYHQTGILYLGEASSVVLAGCLESSKRYHIPMDTWSRADTLDRFPQFQYPEGWMTLWEPEAGYLDVPVAINSFYNYALNHGAEIHTHEKVLDWKQNDQGIEIRTDLNLYQTDRLIFTSGAWTSQHLKDLQLPLKVTRQSFAWLNMDDGIKYSSPSFPCWFIHDPKMGMYYGFPDAQIKDQTEPSGIKLGLHMQGMETSPDRVDRLLRIQDEDIIQYFCSNYLPAAIQVPKTYKTCMYTNTPDENFIIDYIPNSNDKVIMACGFSGHGFKFAPVIGEILTAMALGQKITLRTDFLKLKRFVKLNN